MAVAVAVAVVGSGVALVVVAAAVGNAMQVAEGDGEPVPTSDTEDGIGVSEPVGSGEEIENGANDPPTGVPVGRPNDADAGQVLASSRNWTTGCPLAVTTSAPAAVASGSPTRNNRSPDMCSRSVISRSPPNARLIRNCIVRRICSSHVPPHAVTIAVNARN